MSTYKKPKTMSFRIVKQNHVAFRQVETTRTASTPALICSKRTSQAQKLAWESNSASIKVKTKTENDQF